MTNKNYTTEITPPSGIPRINLKEVWRYKDLLFMLIKRDVFGKYRQSILGFTWAFVPPLVQMIVFTLIFGKMGNMGPSGDTPYYLFSFAALLPWNYFSKAMNSSGNSLISGKGLLTKVYFPRLILPLTGVLGSLVDFAIGFVALMILFLISGVYPSMKILTLPAFLLLAIISVSAVSLWLTSLSVKYRDVKFIIPFLVQVWMFVTPVIFSLEKVPEKYKLLVWLNPMCGVVEGFRWCLISTYDTPNWGYMGISLVITLLVLISGLFYFKYTENTFADII
ncbi:MAG: ABC transporter permease [Verrucomicrobiota bacterium]|nr:ABC transporter permease [Verrucomicrobiota bacterium]